MGGSRPLESTSQITWLPEVATLFFQGSRFWVFCFLFFFFSSLHFFFLRAGLRSQQNQGKGTDISYVPVPGLCSPALVAPSSQLTDLH